MKICDVAGCSRTVRARDLCSSHYNRRYLPDRHKRVNTCARCGTRYETTRTDGRFCSLLCRDDSRRAARLPVHVGPSTPHTAVPARHPARRVAARRLEWWTLLVAGNCAWCESYFVGLASDRARAPRYCSRRCIRGAERHRSGRFVIAPQVRLAIYERDEWTCQLCGDPVDPDLDPSDVWAATLDHIECQSWVLIPDHSPRNLRLAHRWCNSARGDERYIEAA